MLYINKRWRNKNKGSNESSTELSPAAIYPCTHRGDIQVTFTQCKNGTPISALLAKGDMLGLPARKKGQRRHSIWLKKHSSGESHTFQHLRKHRHSVVHKHTRIFACEIPTSNHVCHSSLSSLLKASGVLTINSSEKSSMQKGTDALSSFTTLFI